MGAEGLLSGWWSAFLPLLSPLSLSQRHTNTSAYKGTHAHAHIHSLTHSARDTHEKVGVPTLTHALAHTCICDMQDIAIATGG